MRAFITLLITCLAVPVAAQPNNWPYGCPNGRCVIPSGPPAAAGAWQQENPAPHAIVRVVNARGVEQSLGSGTLIDKNDRLGLVLTCGHLFREGVGTVTVTFASGEGYGAKVLSIDQPADLAALLIRVPSQTPVVLANELPSLGDPLTSCGFGPDGVFWCNRGTLLRYVTTAGNSSADTLELSGTARQGDSGGPVLDRRGELVGVLFGTNSRVVDGTCCLRIRRFLGPLSPKFRALPAAPQPGGKPDPVPALQGVIDQFTKIRADVAQLKQEAATTRTTIDGQCRSLGDRIGKLSQLGANLADIKQQLAHAQSIHDPSRLRALVHEVAVSVVSQKTTDFAGLLWPIVGGALGLSTPPTAVFVAIKLIAWFARRKRTSKSSSSAKVAPRKSATPSPLNDDYARQLVEVFQHSGRSPVQDATLGREYDEEMRRAEQSSDAVLSRWARALREKVEAKFHRIHGQSPAPAEPVDSSPAER